MSKQLNNNGKIPKPPAMPKAAKSFNSTNSKTETPLLGVPSGVKPTGVWTTVHAGVRVGDRRAGRLEKKTHATGIWIRGEERLASLGGGTYAEGGVSPIVTLNPQNWGPRTKLLCFPYAKFKITKLKLRFVTGTPSTAKGVLYMGAYLDPDQPVPQGSGAPTLWTELGENVIEFSVYANADLDVRLRLDEQDPLFVDNTEDSRFGSQGSVFLGGGTATDVVTGQFFIEYECKLLDENMESFPSGCLIGSSDAMVSLASGYEVFRNNPVNANINATAGPYTNFVGDRTILLATETDAAPGTEANMIFPQVGVFMFTTYFACNTTAAAITGTPLFSPSTGSITDPGLLDYAGGTVSGTIAPDWMTSGISGAQVPANRLTNSALSGNTTTNGVLSATWFFLVNTPNSTAIFTAPTCSAGNMRTIFILSRVQTVPGTFGIVRPGPMVVNSAGKLLLPPSTFDYLQNAKANLQELDDKALLVITRACASALREDQECANICIAALDLPLQPFPSSTNIGAKTQFHPAIVNIGAWLLRTFGPLLAEKMLYVAKEKVDAFIKKHK